MFRRLPTILAVLSLALLAGTLWLWWHSGRGCDVLVEPSHYGERWLVTSEFGVLVFERQQAQPLRAGEPRPGWEFFPDRLPRRWPGHWQWLGFEAYREKTRHYLLAPPAPAAGMVVPHWFVAAVLSVLPARQWRRMRRRALERRRRRMGLCPVCGYDLRASTGRCPECGQAIAGRTGMPAGAEAGWQKEWGLET